MLPKHMKLTEEIEKLYLRDLPAIKLESLNQIFRTYFNYSIKDSLKDCQADAIYWYGSKEMKCIKESARLFKSHVNNCKIIELKGYRHAEISSYRPEEWVEKVEEFLNS